jgi:hypothetical protein
VSEILAGTSRGACDLRGQVIHDECVLRHHAEVAPCRAAPGDFNTSFEPLPMTICSVAV